MDTKESASMLPGARQATLNVTEVPNKDRDILFRRELKGRRSKPFAANQKVSTEVYYQRAKLDDLYASRLEKRGKFLRLSTWTKKDIPYQAVGILRKERRIVMMELSMIGHPDMLDVAYAFPNLNWGPLRHRKPVTIVTPHCEKGKPKGFELFTQREALEVKTGYSPEVGFCIRDSSSNFIPSSFSFPRETGSIPVVPAVFLFGRGTSKISNTTKSSFRESTESSRYVISEKKLFHLIDKNTGNKPKSLNKTLKEEVVKMSKKDRKIRAAAGKLAKIVKEMDVKNLFLDKKQMLGFPHLPEISKEQVSTLIDSLEKLSNGVKVDISQPKTDIASSAISFILIIYLLASERSYARISILITAYILALRMPLAVFEKLWSSVKPYWKDFQNWLRGDKKQSISGDFFQPIVGVLTSLALYGIIGGDDRKLPNLIKIGTSASALNQVRGLSQSLSLIVESVVKCVKIHVFGFEDHESAIYQYDEWRRHIEDTIYNPDWLRTLFEDRSRIVAIHDIENKGRTLLEMLKDGSSVYRTPILELLKDVRRHRESLEALFGHKTSAPQAVFVVYYGKTGVGKTYSIEMTMHNLLEGLPLEAREKVKHPYDLFWVKQSASEYAEGFHGQPFTLWDELFQSTNKDTLNEETSQVFNMVTSHNMPMNMAKAELKGQIYFTSLAIFATTNKKNWADLPIIDHDALTRRRDFFFEQKVYKQFQVDGGTSLCPRKWEKHCEASGLDSNVPDYAYYQMLDDKGNDVGSYLTYQEHLAVIEEAMAVNRRKYNSKQSTLQDRFVKHLAQLSIDKKAREQEELNKKQGWVSDTLSGAFIFKRYTNRTEGEKVVKKTYPLDDVTTPLSDFNIDPEKLNEVCLVDLESLGHAESCYEKTVLQYVDIKYIYDGPLLDSEKWLVIFTYNLYFGQWFHIADKLSARIPNFDRSLLKVRSWEGFKEFKERIPYKVDGTSWQRFKQYVSNNKTVVLWASFMTAFSAIVLAGGLFNFFSKNSEPVDDNTEGRTYDKGTVRRISGNRWRRFKESQDFEQSFEDLDHYNGVQLEFLVSENLEIDEDLKQAQYDAGVENLVGALTQQIVVVSAMGPFDSVLASQRAIIVCTDFLLVNKHLLFKDGNFNNNIRTIRVCRAGKFSVDIPVEVVKDNISLIGSKWQYDDVALVYVKNFVGGRNIVKHFLKTSEVLDLMDGIGELLVPDGNVLTRMVGNFKSTDVAVKAYGGNLDLRVDNELRAIKGYHYDLPTTKGHCGAPFIRWDSKASTKILGIHAAGGLKKPSVGGFCCIVDQEWLEDTISKYSVVKRQSDEVELEPYTGRNSIQETPIGIIGYVPAGKRVKLPEKETQSIPSILQAAGLFPVTTAPTTCQYYGDGNRLHAGFLKFTEQTRALDVSKVNMIRKAICYKYFSDPSRPTRVLNWKESLNAYDNIRSINLNSSMGYPWVLSHQKKKSFIEYVEEEQSYDFVPGKGEELLARLDKIDAKMALGIAPELIQLCYLKDERLALDKIAEGKCRVFMGCPIETTLIFRKYFGSFMNYLASTRSKHGIMLNMNPYEEWDTMCSTLLEKSDEVLCLDYKAFDRTIPPQLISMFFRIADHYYGSDNRLQRACLESIIVRPILQVMNIRFEVSTLNSSGNPATGPINSFANMAKTIYALMDQIDINSAMGNCWSAYLGDDEISAFGPEIDLPKYMDSLRNMGFKPTSAQKDGNIGFVPLKEAQFLKRGFRLDNGRWKGPLQLSTIRDSLLWQKRGNNEIIAMEETVRCALLEYELHDINLIKDDVRRIVSVCTLLGIELPYSENTLNCLESEANFEKDLCFRDPKNWDYSCDGGLIWTGCVMAIPRGIWLTEDSPKYSYDGSWTGIVKKVVITKVDVSRLMRVGSGLWHIGFTEIDNGVLGRHLTHSSKGLVFSDWFKGHNDLNRNNWIVHSLPMDLVVPDSLLDSGIYHETENNCIRWAEKVLNYNNKNFKLEEKFFKFLDFYYPNHVPERGREILDRKQADDGIEIVDEDEMKTVFNTATLPVSFPTSGGVKGELRAIPALLGTKAVVANFKWSTDQIINSEIGVVNFPSALLNSPQFKSKVAFNELIRFDIDVEVVCVAPPFDHGKAIMTWVPLYKLGWPASKEVHALGMTAMNHVCIEPGNKNVARMLIPFTHVKNYIHPRSGSVMESLGSLIIKVINPYTTESTVSSLTVIVKANFVNVELSIPTPLLSGATWSESDNYPRYIKQSDEAQVKSQQGVISGVANSVGGVARLLMGVPVFKPIASGVAAISHVVGGIAQAIGLSKPISLESTRPVIVRPFTGVSFREGLDMSIPLGTSPNNHVAIQPGHFGSAVDELNLKYLFKTPTCVLTKKWRNEKCSTTLVKMAVHPFMGTGMKAGSHEAVQLSMMGYLSTLFYWWRGSIQVHVEVIKTQYHAGVLLIGYVPSGCLPDGDQMSVETTSHVQLDIGQEVASADFTIPFVSTQYFNRVGTPFDLLNLKDHIATGTLVIKVLNPLTRPETAPDHVYLNIWVSAGDDFEVALPSLHGIRTIGYGYEDPDVKRPSWSKYNRKQGLTRERAVWQLGPAAPPLPAIEVENVDFKDAVMGEEIKNLRDILKISCQKWSSDVKLDDIETVIPVHSFLRDSDEKAATYYDHIMRIFRYSRGTLRHKIVTSQFDGTLSASVSTMQDSGAYYWHKSVEPNNSPWAISVPKMNPTLEYAIPYYSSDRNQIHGSDDSIRAVRLKVDTFEGVSSKQILHLVVYESVGDDFSAGYLMGPPVLYQKDAFVIQFVKALKMVWDNGQTMTQPADSSWYPVGMIPTLDDHKITVDNNCSAVMAQKIWYWSYLWTNNRNVWIQKAPVVQPEDLLLLFAKESVNSWTGQFFVMTVPVPNPVYSNIACALQVSKMTTYMQGVWLYVDLQPAHTSCSVVKNSLPAAQRITDAKVGGGDFTLSLFKLTDAVVSGIAKYRYADVQVTDEGRIYPNLDIDFPESVSGLMNSF